MVNYHVEFDKIPFKEFANSDKTEFHRCFSRSSTIKPTHIMNLYDAFFCYLNGIDPHTSEAERGRLIQYPDYKNREYLETEDKRTFQELMNTYKSYRCIETDLGTVVFNQRNLLPDRLNHLHYIKFIADNFYNENLGINTMNCYSL